MTGAVAAFLDDRLIARGPPDEVTRLVEERFAPSDHVAVRVFDEETGRVLDLDYWDAGKAAAGERPRPDQLPARARGRPKLGVVAREVTLLPRQWEWLQRQPGGASSAIRRLVEEARKAGPGEREAREAAHRFMTEMAGDRPGYEDALRCLYRGDFEGVRAIARSWPEDIRLFLERFLG